MTTKELSAIKRRCKKDRRLWITVHEASHAFFALTFELPFSHIIVYDTVRNNTEGELVLGGRTNHAALTGNPYGDAMLRLAGVAVDEWLSGFPVETTDVEEALAAAESICEDRVTAARYVKKVLTPAAHAMLMDNVASIVKLGEVLYQRGRMTEQECRDVLASNSATAMTHAARTQAAAA